MGKQIKPIVEDGASDPKTYNEKANKLVVRDRVPTVFGFWPMADFTWVTVMVLSLMC